MAGGRSKKSGGLYDDPTSNMNAEELSNMTRSIGSTAATSAAGVKAYKGAKSAGSTLQHVKSFAKQVMAGGVSTPEGYGSKENPPGRKKSKTSASDRRKAYKDTSGGY